MVLSLAKKLLILEKKKRLLTSLVNDPLPKANTLHRMKREFEDRLHSRKFCLLLHLIANGFLQTSSCEIVLISQVYSNPWNKQKNLRHRFLTSRKT